MANKMGRSGITGKVMDLLKATPNALWTWEDILNELPEENERSVQNCIHRLYVKGDVMRHIKPEEETNRNRYAIHIPEKNRAEYIKTEYKGVSRKKGTLPNSREIRTAFAQAMNQLAKLEDMVTSVVDLAEDTEKKMKKIENLLK